MDIRITNILISSRVTEAGLITPPDGWYELGSVENPGLTIGTHAEGLHAYDYDISVGPSGIATPTVIDQDADGIYATSSDGSGTKTASVVHSCSCSLELDPVVSIVWRYDTSQVAIRMGVSSEDVSDNQITNYVNLRIGGTFNAGGWALAAREQALISIGKPAISNGQWVQWDFDPSDYGRSKLYFLASGDLADRDPGGVPTITYDHAFNANLPGSVIAPFFGFYSTGAGRIRAVRMQPRPAL